jgi:hypothetical protein
VESNDLGTNDVFTRCDVGKLEGVLSLLSVVRTVTELGNSPRLAVPAILSNLDPRHARASLGNVDVDGSLVGSVDDLVTGSRAVVVPLDLGMSADLHSENAGRNTYSDLITTVDGNRLGGLDVGYVALHCLGSDIGNGRVVGRRVDVATLGVAVSLVLAVDGNTPDGGVGGGSTDEGEGRDEALHFAERYG